MTVYEAIKRLQRAARTLAPDQKRVARGNARKRVRVALRAVRDALDAEYPPVAKARVRRATVLRSPNLIGRRMRARDWVAVSTRDSSRLAVSGIKTVTRESSMGTMRFAPAWAAEILNAAKGDDPGRLLSDARRDRTYRRALVAFFQMGGAFAAAPRRQRRAQ